jgi:hypothetical protein
MRQKLDTLNAMIRDARTAGDMVRVDELCKQVQQLLDGDDRKVWVG